jgi:aldehyde dehydrogenase (NAD+)
MMAMDEDKIPLERQCDFSLRKPAPTLAERQDRLQRFERFIRSCRKSLCASMAADMKRPQAEIYTSEIAPVLAEIRYAKRHLGAWMKPRQVKSSLFNFRSRSCYAPKPYGRALIIGPWNYPFGLVAAPAVHALAAGTRVLL